MITDEQVKVALDAYYYHGNVMREALEAYEQSKWVKFDINNPSTHPSIEQNVNAVTFRGKVVTLRFNGIDDETGLPMWFWQATDDQTNLTVTHWQPLPEFKG